MNATRSLPMLLAAALAVLPACRAAASSPEVAAAPPSPAEADRGDPGDAGRRGVELAERVIERLGGREAFDRARYASWLFFGRRRHLWDKHTGDVRIDDEAGAWTILVNVHTREGAAWRDGEPVRDETELAELLRQGYEMWVNDSYWVFMPWKLLDPGVSLRHLGDGALPDGRSAERLELTFEGVGVTPENRYVVWVAKDTGLVEEWDFFAQATDTEPRRLPGWRDWTPHRGSYGEIWLPGSHGDGPSWEVEVLEDSADVGDALALPTGP